MILESELVEKLKSDTNIDSAFKELVSLYKERLYWHIRHIVKSHDDADDVLQNTFIKVYKNIGNFKGESKLFSWMYRIATNEAITFINNKAKRNGTTSEALQTRIVENLHADVYFDGNEIQIKLQKAIVLLPEKQQQVFADPDRYRNPENGPRNGDGFLRQGVQHAVVTCATHLCDPHR